MSTGSGIQWTNTTWNPVTGCTRVSAGCDNCYAVQMSHRLEMMGQTKYAGLTVVNGQGDRHFNGKVKCHEFTLKTPLSWKKPSLVFVNSMSDLFHDEVPFDFIDKVFAVMAICPQHTFQVLTKRPERMAEYFDRMAGEYEGIIRQSGAPVRMPQLSTDIPWPLPNVWLGTSCEDQAAADKRIPHLRQCPAAALFLSCEPLLGPLDVSAHLTAWTRTHLSMSVAGALRNRAFDGFTHKDGTPACREDAETYLRELHESGVKLIRMGDCDDFDHDTGCRGHRSPGVDWVIVGGESGGRSRGCNVGWIRQLVQQCKSAEVPVFVKQLGAHAYEVEPTTEPTKQLTFSATAIGDAVADLFRRSKRIPLRDKHGGDPAEWPEDLRIRQWPAVAAEREAQ